MHQILLSRQDLGFDDLRLIILWSNLSSQTVLVVATWPDPRVALNPALSIFLLYYLIDTGMEHDDKC